MRIVERIVKLKKTKEGGSEREREGEKAGERVSYLAGESRRLVLCGFFFASEGAS